MKKYIPVILTLSLGLVVLSTQVFFKSEDINASPSKDKNKLNLHYESVLKEVKLEVNGKKVKLIDDKAPIIILNFWASWCVPCLEEFPSLVDLHSKYDKSKVKIVGINTDDPDSYKDAKKIIDKYKIKFPIIFDKENKLIEKFKVTAIPISIIYKNGRVLEVSNGAKDFISEEFLEVVNEIVKN